MEAEVVRDYLATRANINTLLLVTSSQHTRRAFKLFKAAFRSIPEPPDLYCSPSSYTNFNAEKWWRNKNDIQKVVEEYMKLTNFVLFEKRELKKSP